MLSTANIATLLVAILVTIGAVVGGVVCIANPDTLSFDQYLSALSKFAIGVGLLGIGRGVAAAGKSGAKKPPTAA